MRLDVVALVLAGFAVAGTVWQAREAIAARDAAEVSARAAHAGEMPVPLSQNATLDVLAAGVTSTVTASIPGSEQTQVSDQSFRETYETRFCVSPHVMNSNVSSLCPQWNDAR